MSKREDQRLAALAKKNAEKVVQPKGDKSVQFDPTLRQRHGEEDPETRRLFKEMKKRAYYEKPSVKRKRKQAEARKKRRKAMKRTEPED